MLALQGRGFRLIEAFVMTLIVTIAACFAYEIFFAHPLWREARADLFREWKFCATGRCCTSRSAFLGATVMPHNLYLHSSIVQTRAFATDAAGKREALRFAMIDSDSGAGFALVYQRGDSGSGRRGVSTRAGCTTWPRFPMPTNC